MTKPTKKPKARRPSGTYRKPGEAKAKPWAEIKPWERVLGPDKPAPRAKGNA